MATNLESHIDQVIQQAAAKIAKAVRSELAAEIHGVLEGRRASARGRRRTARAPRMVKARSNGNGNGNGARSPHPRRSYTDGDVERLLGLIADSPGLRSAQIQEQSGLDKHTVNKVLARLRSDEQVKTTGERRAMTYST